MTTRSLPILSSHLASFGDVPSLFHPQLLPERVLQFGTGVLLRALPDYLIDQANRQGIFNGRVVVVKSTDGGDIDAFRRQDNLYTVCVRGVEENRLVDRPIVCSAISRVLSAQTQWVEILRIAASPDLQIVISNTTEAGIQFVDEDIRQTPPQSFPAKLLAVLHARYQAFEGDLSKGLVIVPTELLPDNGTKLEGILLELAHRNELSPTFIDWLETANTFCNSLVDRIVPGRPEPETYRAISEAAGYHDELLTVAEVYRLWAIEVPPTADLERTRQVLSFHQADEHVIIRPDINRFRTLKLRLLNGTHTLSCGLAFLGGFDTVSEAMADQTMASYMSGLLLAELIPGLPRTLDDKAAQRYSFQVLDRFRNPYIEHRWLAITLNYSLKMQLRNVPTLVNYYQHAGFGDGPITSRYMALGFAAYLLFMRATVRREGIWYGERNGGTYPIEDVQAPYFADLWTRLSPDELVQAVLQNTDLWGHDLTQLPGFSQAVAACLSQLLQKGVKATLLAQANPRVSGLHEKSTLPVQSV